MSTMTVSKSDTLVQCPVASNAISSTYSQINQSNSKEQEEFEIPILGKDILLSTFTSDLSSPPNTPTCTKNNHNNSKNRVEGIHSTVATPAVSTCNGGGAEGGDTPRIKVVGSIRPTNVRASSFPIRQRIGSNDSKQEKVGDKKDSEGKDRFVDGLVGACVLAIESIWGSAGGSLVVDGVVLPLHWFVKEVLRRSRTSCSTLQIALYYLHQARRQIREIVSKAKEEKLEFQELEKHFKLQQDYPSPPSSPVDSFNRYEELLPTQISPLLCGRRIFLSSLICASKFLQDRNYSNKAWAKISGLGIEEINSNERAFLKLIGYQLFVGSENYFQWTVRLASISTPIASPEIEEESKQLSDSLPCPASSTTSTSSQHLTGIPMERSTPNTPRPLSRSSSISEKNTIETPRSVVIAMPKERKVKPMPRRATIHSTTGMARMEVEMESVRVITVN